MFLFCSLTGSVPKSFQSMTRLQTFLIQNNKLSGPLQNCFDPETQTVLEHVDVGNNHFTGTLPLSIFNGMSLLTFSAVRNCLSGSLSDDLCLAPNLNVLSLDGLHTAKECQNVFFPLISQSYLQSNYIHGTIAPCLFRLPSLQTLHLSGNGFTGPIIVPTSINSNFADLSLSYNLLTGTIPDIIQNKQWNSLDLSHNKLNGFLSHNIPSYDSNQNLKLSGG